MEFGKVDQIDLNSIDFSLPTDHLRNNQVLKGMTGNPVEIYIGCAKWGRKDWIGKLYPKGTKEADFLSFYAKYFNAIELNSVFYGIPDEGVIKKWKESVPPNFRFFPKFTQYITYIKRLKDATESTNEFLAAMSLFGENLGPCFLMLPPNFPPKNFDILKNYLCSLPKDFKYFVEFRHPEWFKGEVFDKIFYLMEELKIGSVITDASGTRNLVHQRLPTSDAFIRYVGNGLHETDYKRIDQWVQKFKEWQQMGLTSFYFFMHQHEEIHSPQLIAYMIKQLNKEAGLNLKEIPIIE